MRSRTLAALATVFSVLVLGTVTVLGTITSAGPSTIESLKEAWSAQIAQITSIDSGWRDAAATGVGATAPASFVVSPQVRIGGLSKMEEEAVRRIVIEHIGAVATGRVDSAFASLSPNAQTHIGAPRRLAGLLARDFPALRDVKRFEFDGMEAGAYTVVRVRISNATGATTLVRFHMERQTDGSWRVGGYQAEPFIERAT